MKKYKMLIFDMDGTILYTLEDLKNTTNYALNEHGFRNVHWKKYAGLSETEFIS